MEEKKHELFPHRLTAKCTESECFNMFLIKLYL